MRPGDILTLRHDLAFTADILSLGNGAGTGEDADGISGLVTDTFTVTATVESPRLLFPLNTLTLGSSPVDETPVGCVCFADVSSFDTAAFGGYPRLLLRSENLAGIADTDTYRAQAEELLAKIRPVLSEIDAERRAAGEAAVALFLDGAGAAPEYADLADADTHQYAPHRRLRLSHLPALS